MKFYGLIAAITLLIAPIQFGVASAMDKDDMAMPSMDCGTANATMMKMMTPDMTKMKMDADNVDKNYKMAMSMMSKHGMMMSKLEAKCGKDAKTREDATKMAGELQELYTRIGTPIDI